MEYGLIPSKSLNQIGTHGKNMKVNEKRSPAKHIIFEERVITSLTSYNHGYILIANFWGKTFWLFDVL